MRVKVELTERAKLDLRQLCNSEEIQEFFAKADLLVREPIKNSEIHMERGLRERVLRRFRFGSGVTKIAIFEFDAAKLTIRILRCRLLRPRRIQENDANDA